MECYDSEDQIKDQRRLFTRTTLILAVLLLLAVDVHAIKVDECKIALSFSDWRVVIGISLLITALFIGILYMYGSAFDNSFIARAKNELFQLAGTVVLILLFATTVQFMCGDLIPSLFGFQESTTYEVAETYLEELSSYTFDNFKKLLGVQAGLSLFKSVSGVGELKTGIIKSTGMLQEVMATSFGLSLIAYILTITQFFMLDYIRLITLTIFLPAGILLRGFYPFRNFGGALIGAAIALYLMVPLLLMVNKVMIDPFFENQRIFEANECKLDSDCYSNNCKFGITGNKCSSLISENLNVDERTCSDNRQCTSGYCDQTNNVCVSCGGNGEKPFNKNCCKGFTLDEDSNKCSIAKKNGESCEKDTQCISGYCTDSTKICQSKKIGPNDRCQRDGECWYGSCTNVGDGKNCSRTILTEEDVLFTRARDIKITEITKTDYDAKPNILGGNKGIIEWSEDLLDSFIGGLIGGIILPALNIVLISSSVRSMSEFFGSEIDLAKLWKIV